MAERRADPSVLPVYVIVAVLAALAAATLGSLKIGLGATLAAVVMGAVLFTPLGLRIAAVIDTLTNRLGETLAWAILLAVIVSAVNAVVRKVFNASSNAWLELQWVLFGLVFLWCSPWTLLDNEHIRIDIVNSRLPKRMRDWIDVLGHALFLIPFTLIMVVIGLPFARRSVPGWQELADAISSSPTKWFGNILHSGELSLSAEGLPQWPAKCLIPTGFALLLLQGLSELIKRVAVMRGQIDDPHAAQPSQVELEAERVLQMAQAESDAQHLGTPSR